MQNLLHEVTTWGEGTLGAAWPVVWNLAKIVALLVPLLACVAHHSGKIWSEADRRFQGPV